MPGQVIQGHAKWEEDCTKCHKRFDKSGQTTLCQDCHKDVRTDIGEKRGYHGRLKEQRECKECHTEHKGRGENIAKINEHTFDHAQSDFPLTGTHADNKKTDCKSCHKPKVRYRDAPSDCLSCHKKDDAHKGLFGGKCADCHTDQDWKSLIFNHDRDTKYPLLDTHRTVKCENCHTGHLYKDKLKTDCYSCHKKDDYHKGIFGPKCETCHAEKDWKRSPFNHDKDTRYPLLGMHKAAKCESCHTAFTAKGKTPNSCHACHKKDDTHQGTLGTACETCHTVKDWKDTPAFDHSNTKFPLLGKHVDTTCKECHPDQRYKPTPLDCYSCHKKDDYHKGTFSPKCETCHAEKDWKRSSFNHDKDTTYPLTGKHKTAKCESCHLIPVTKEKTPTACLSCHKASDTHKGQYGEKCESCHTDRTWKEIIFDHDRDTKYLLRDKHKPVTCKSCHKGHLYKEPVSTTCITCHRKDDSHNGVLGQKCETCHAEKDWKRSTFDHDRDTKYLLLGAHDLVKCEACHTVPIGLQKTPTACAACHKKDDLHKGRYGNTCESCHREKSWKLIRFNHDRDTTYLLKGLHKTTKCDSCHKGRLYQDKTPTACYACHKKNDIHTGAYGELCGDCHVESKWKTVAFDHDRHTTYPLRGKHLGVRCESCHKGRLYLDKTPTDCFACHKKDDEHHGQEGNQCETCHREASWKRSTFDHDKARFPLRGQHELIDCKKCHKTMRFKDAPVECTGCHEKEDVHKRRFGTQCDLCHSARDWKLWDFEHDVRTQFPLEGAHKTAGCYDCHRKPVGAKVVTPNSCESCHRKDDKHGGGFGPQCDRCHLTESWKTIKPGAGAFRNK